MSSLTSSGKLFLVLTAPKSEFHPIYSRLYISVDPKQAVRETDCDLGRVHESLVERGETSRCSSRADQISYDARAGCWVDSWYTHVEESARELVGNREGRGGRGS